MMMENCEGRWRTVTYAHGVHAAVNHNHLLVKIQKQATSIPGEQGWLKECLFSCHVSQNST